MMNNWTFSSEEIFNQGPVVPVLVIENVEDAVPIAKALMAGGINVLEVTLRTDAAMDVIRIIAKEVPDAAIYLVVEDGESLVDRGPLLTGTWDQLRSKGLEIFLVGAPALEEPSNE